MPAVMPRCFDIVVLDHTINRQGDAPPFIVRYDARMRIVIGVGDCCVLAYRPCKKVRALSAASQLTVFPDDQVGGQIFSNASIAAAKITQPNHAAPNLDYVAMNDTSVPLSKATVIHRDNMLQKFRRHDSSYRAGCMRTEEMQTRRCRKCRQSLTPAAVVDMFKSVPV